MTPFEAFLLAMLGVLVAGACVTYAIYRQKRRRK